MEQAVAEWSYSCTVRVGDTNTEMINSNWNKHPAIVGGVETIKEIFWQQFGPI